MTSRRRDMSVLCYFVHVATCGNHVVTSSMLPGSLVLSRRRVIADFATSTATHEFHPLSSRDMSR